MVCCETFISRITRRKSLTPDHLQTSLRRCLGVADLTMLGMGGMVGAGVFIISGVVAKEKAGPGVVLCYLLAGVAMLLSSMCYAEFGARVPKAGSAYIFTYLTLGEVYAFVVGWDIVLKRLLGGAAAARGWSAMFDAMLGNIIQNTTAEYIPSFNIWGTESYLDLVAFCVIIVVVMVASAGVTCLVHTNMLFTLANLMTLVIVTGIGFWKADWSNWSSESLGGFLPYGWQGVAAGTATLFYTFIGFESITNAAEEATEPGTQIPVAILLSILLTTLIYTSSSAALTLMIPFTSIDIVSPFPGAFKQLGLNWAVYLASVGALLGMTTSILADLFALPRNIYAMASDGLLFNVFAWVHPITHTPIVATVVFGIISAVLALLIPYQTLVEFLSIGSLVSYTTVSICVIVNRYRPTSPDPGDQAETSPSQYNGPVLLEEFRNNKFLSSVPGSVMIYLSILVIIISTVILSCLLKYNSLYDIYGPDKMWVLSLVFGSMMAVFTALFFISAYEEINEPSTFSVPLSPHIPAISIMINVALLIQLPREVWIRYAVWVASGLLAYLMYGIHHSRENRGLQESGQTLMSYSALQQNDELNNE